MVRWWSSTRKVRRWKKFYTVEPAVPTLPRKLLVHQASLETCPTPPAVMVFFEAVVAGWLCRGLHLSAECASLSEYRTLYRVVKMQQASRISEECGLSRMRRLISAVDVSELSDAAVQRRQGRKACVFRISTARPATTFLLIHCPERCMGFHFR